MYKQGPPCSSCGQGETCSAQYPGLCGQFYRMITIFLLQSVFLQRPLDQIRPQWNHPYHQHPGNNLYNPRSNLCSQKYNLQKQPKLHSEISKWHPKQMCPSLPHKHQYQGLPRELQQEGRQREEEPHQDELSPPPSPRLSSSPTMTWRLTSKL